MKTTRKHFGMTKEEKVVTTNPRIKEWRKDMERLRDAKNGRHKIFIRRLASRAIEESYGMSQRSKKSGRHKIFIRELASRAIEEDNL